MTDSFFGGSNGVPAAERCRIRRAYGRVSRDKMQANLKARLAAAGVTKIRGTADPMSVRSYECFLRLGRASTWRASPVFSVGGGGGETGRSLSPRDKYLNLSCTFYVSKMVCHLRKKKKKSFRLRLFFLSINKRPWCSGRSSVL